MRFFRAIDSFISQVDNFDAVVMDCTGRWNPKHRITQNVYFPRHEKANDGFGYTGGYAILINNAKKDKVLDCLKKHRIDDFDSSIIYNYIRITSYVLRTTFCRHWNKFGTNIST